MLIAYEQGVRRDGVTSVKGLPPSNLRDFRKKLTFVPAGHDYRECQELRALSRITFFHLDPSMVPLLSDDGVANLAPRLYFEDVALWDTALKLTTLIESSAADNRPYLEALGTVLAHELARLGQATTHVQTIVRGGLAAWQQRVVTSFIEDHLAEQISLATLAKLIHLSTYHFCRAFKQSFGIPPHRFHTSRRIERAKALLAKPAPSVTDIGLTVGIQPDKLVHGGLSAGDGTYTDRILQEPWVSADARSHQGSQKAAGDKIRSNHASAHRLAFCVGRRCSQQAASHGRLFAYPQTQGMRRLKPRRRKPSR